MLHFHVHRRRRKPKTATTAASYRRVDTSEQRALVAHIRKYILLVILKEISVRTERERTQPPSALSAWLFIATQGGRRCCCCRRHPLCALQERTKSPRLNRRQRLVRRNTRRHRRRATKPSFSHSTPQLARRSDVLAPFSHTHFHAANHPAAMPVRIPSSRSSSTARGVTLSSSSSSSCVRAATCCTRIRSSEG